MTDEQVIKALRLCANAKDCRECPLHSMYSANCIKKLMNTTLDIIKRQQAEKEALIAGQETLQKALAEKNVEIERLQKEKEDFKNWFNEANFLLTDAYNTVEEMSKNWQCGKHKAIKEFAERLKEKMHSGITMSGESVLSIHPRGIDNLIKEMTEESNGE